MAPQSESPYLKPHTDVRPQRVEIMSTAKADPDPNLAGMVFDALRAGVDDEIDARFARYVRDHRTDRWLLFSDYVLGVKERPNDVFAFTVAAAGKYLPGLTQDFEANAKRDFKEVRNVGEPMMRLMRDSRLFTYCFVVDPKRILTRNVATIRGMFDRSIARLNAKPDRALYERDIKTLKAVRSKADSPRFSVRLFDNIVLAAAFAGFLTYLICATRRASRVGWFSDRDSIITSHKAFAHHLYAGNVTAFSQRFLDGWVGPSLGVNGPIEEGGTLWCDSFLRVPDYLAGTLSAWNLGENTIPEARKYRQVGSDGIASNPNVQVLRLILKCENNLISAFSQPFAVTRK
jgi:hypothetical protein